MIYTSYISKISKLPYEDDNVKIYIITRWKPRSLNLNKYNAQWRPSLAPPEYLLSAYNDEKIIWAEFILKFNEYMETNRLFKESFNDIIKKNNEGYDVYLLCYEKDYTICHRGIIKSRLNSMGIKCIEYGSEPINDEESIDFKCRFPTCKFNTSCCAAPSKVKGDNFYCKLKKTKKELGYSLDEDDCKSYVPGFEKNLKCVICEQEDYGEIGFERFKESEKVFKKILHELYPEYDNDNKDDK